MKSFEILTESDGLGVRVLASTRAGLVTAAVQGVFAAAKPKVDEDDETETERLFAFEAADFGTLLSDLLDGARTASAKHAETFIDVRFTLITDKKAQGAFIGKPAKGFAKEIPPAPRGMSVEKNEAGEWETTLVFSS